MPKYQAYFNPFTVRVELTGRIMRRKEIILIASAVATGVLAACETLSELKEAKDDEQ